MKKTLLLSLIMILMTLSLGAQNVEIEGRAKITVMNRVTNGTLNVVRGPDGTLAYRRYIIGDMAQGGIVFWVDESGEHGLVADTEDLSSSIRWFAGTNGNTQAKGDGPFAGEMNTAIIISSQVAIGDDGNTYAARLCAELQKGGYGDWYLPSKEELKLMFINLYLEGLGDFNMGGFYWSSTEAANGKAWSRPFNEFTSRDYDDGKNFTLRVRAIRAF